MASPHQKKTALKSLPNHLMVLGQKVVVTQDSSMAKDFHGEADVGNLQIRINPRHSDMSKISLIHELVHTALGLSGVSEFLDEKQEEAICCCLEHALLDYVRFPGEDD